LSIGFNEFTEFIKKRIVDQGIGFGVTVTSQSERVDYLKHVKPEDLIKFGFETEFVGRLPVISVFEELTEDDLYAILRNPNNPVMVSKKLDFKAYDIWVNFEDRALRALAHLAYEEQTEARGLVSAMEKVLLKLEKKLPSTEIKKLPVTEEVVKDPEGMLQEIISTPDDPRWTQLYEKVVHDEKESVKEYLRNNQAVLAAISKIGLTPSRIDLIADVYAMSAWSINGAMSKIGTY